MESSDSEGAMDVDEDDQEEEEESEQEAEEEVEEEAEAEAEAEDEAPSKARTNGVSKPVTAVSKANRRSAPTPGRRSSRRTRGNAAAEDNAEASDDG
jgi:hypothetical protein